MHLVITRDMTIGAMMTGDMIAKDMIAEDMTTEEMIGKEIQGSMIKRIRTGKTGIIKINVKRALPAFKRVARRNSLKEGSVLLVTTACSTS